MFPELPYEMLKAGIEPYVGSQGRFVDPETRRKLGIDDGLIRLSVGIEHYEDLIADPSNEIKNLQSELDNNKRTLRKIKFNETKRIIPNEFDFNFETKNN